MLSHIDTGCIGLACDKAAVADPGLLLTCVEQAFDDVLATSGDDQRVSVPA